jgi:hypothetical protein
MEAIMKIKLAKDEKYRIETVVNIPKDIKDSFEMVEIGFSPNPYDPIIEYELPRTNATDLPLQNIIDYILNREHRLA